MNGALFQSPPHPRPRLLIPYLVMAVSLLLTVAVATYIAGNTAAKDRARFANAVERTQMAIGQRLETYVSMLQGGAGLFAAGENIDRREFGHYVERLELEQRYPGIQGIGVSWRADAASKAQLETQLSQQWGKSLAIKPADVRDEYHAIIYLEPTDERNLAAIGYDMFTNPTRRAAMQKARDTGEAAASGKVMLLQEIDPSDTQWGFLIYVPVYHAPRVPTTVEQRRKQLLGFVYAPFRVGDLLRGILGSGNNRAGIEFSVHDAASSPGINPQTLLHHSDAFVETSQDGARKPRFSSTRRLGIPGRQWVIEYQSGPTFESTGTRGFTILALVLGGAVSVLLFALTAAQAAAQQRAEHAADELRKSEQALRASESRFRRLADANLVGVAFSTIDGRVLDANDEYLRIVGRTRQQVEAGEVRWDSLTPPQYIDFHRRAVEELMRRGNCAPFEKEFERPDGTRVPVLVAVAMLESSATETVALYVDLTKQKEAERELVRAKEVAESARADAEQASRLKDDFLATVSHELRTPLNAILGWAQLLRAGRSGPEDLSHGLATIERSAKSQAQLIDDLLDVSRIVAGKLRLEVKVVRPIDVVEAALQSIRPAADAKGVRLVHVLDPDAGPINGDPGRLQQVVWNLLSNAVKFTPRGGVMQVVLKREGSHVSISVSDTGVGIKPEFLPHVFERFRQADGSTTRRYGGLGLGLGIVRHLTELHGGNVHADSPGEGQGATFTVTLPLAIATAHAKADDDPNAQTNGVSLRGVRVLLVEDDADARDLIARALRDHGAQVMPAASAAEAIEAFDLLAPHVLVSDIGMPDEDGYALLARIRARGPERGGRVPAIALTALARPEDRQRATRAGFQVHVAKPVEPAELAAVVANLANPETSLD